MNPTPKPPISALHRGSASRRASRFGVPGLLVVAVAHASTAQPPSQAAPPTSSPPGQSQVADLLERVGIRPLDPPTPALDLELEPVASSPGTSARSIGGGAGRFTVLTFFATWCQPCIAEMPTLQVLHDGDAAVEVLGVSLDDTPEPVVPFLEQLGVDFPVLWDREGRGARLYRAGAIPISYVIDPAGRILGLSRGARDWSQLVGFFEALSAALPSTDAVWVADGEATEPIALPLRLTPPEATVALAESEVRPGRDFALEVRVRWAGNFEQYLLHPPRVALPDGVEEIGVAASTSSSSGSSVVVYRIDLRADSEGEYALDPVELRYTPVHESEPVSRRLSGPTVSVRRPAWQRAVLPVGAAVALGAAAVASVALVLSRRRRRATQTRGVEQDRGELKSAIAEIRRLRLEGEGAQALARLAELATRWLASDGDGGDARGRGADGADGIGVNRRELDDWLERCRYGGEQPPAEVVDRWLRRLERRGEELLDPSERELREELGLGE